MARNREWTINSIVEMIPTSGIRDPAKPTFKEYNVPYFKRLYYPFSSMGYSANYSGYKGYPVTTSKGEQLGWWIDKAVSLPHMNITPVNACLYTTYNSLKYVKEPYMTDINGYNFRNGGTDSASEYFYAFAADTDLVVNTTLIPDEPFYFGFFSHPQKEILTYITQYEGHAVLRDDSYGAPYILDFFRRVEPEETINVTQTDFLGNIPSVFKLRSPWFVQTEDPSIQFGYEFQVSAFNDTCTVKIDDALNYWYDDGVDPIQPQEIESEFAATLLRLDSWRLVGTPFNLDEVYLSYLYDTFYDPNNQLLRYGEDDGHVFTISGYEYYIKGKYFSARAWPNYPGGW